MASIKPNNVVSGGGKAGPSGGVVRFTAGKVAGTATTRTIILAAYHLTDHQLSGGSGWLDNDRFDIEGRAATPIGEDQLRAMLKTLLSERFKLVVRHESKEMPVYALTVGKKGSKLSEANKESPDFQTMPVKAGDAVDAGAFHLFDRGTIQHFADVLSGIPSIDRPVIDKTGLHGTYVLNLVFGADENIMTAIEDKFGLKLESQKAQMDTLVIDHIEKPDPN